MQKTITKPGGNDLTVGNPYARIARFALPMLISQVFQQLYHTADSLIVGRFIGTDGLAAVSASGTLIFLMISFFEGLFMGAGVLISRCYGEKNEDGVSRAVHTDFAVGLTGGVALTVIGVIFTPALLRLINTDPEILPGATEYFRYIFAGALALVMYNVCRGIMTAVGDSRRPLIYLIISSVLNIGLDLLFIGGFGWGVWAAAVATVISQAASVALCLVHLFKKGGVVTVELKKVRFHRDMLKQIIRYGLPAGIQNSVIGFANTIVISKINVFGKVATAAYGVHARIEGFAFMPINSFNMAMTTFIGQNLGARQYDRAKKGARFGILAAVLTAELVGVIYFIFARRLTGLFDSSEAVMALGERQAHITTLFYCLLAFSHSIASVCRGAGKAFVPMTVMLAVWCVFRIAYITVVTNVWHDIRLIYWAYPITWGISSVIYLIYYKASDWVHGFEKEKK